MGKALRFHASRATLGMFALAGLFVLAGSTIAAAADSGPLGLYVSNGALMKAGHPYAGIGANYNSLFGQLLVNGNSHASLDNLARLAKAGIPFVRFRACGFGPESYQLYLHDRPEFFRRMDLVVHCAEENKIGLIPSLFWRLATIPEVVGESRDQLGNSNSKSNQFIRQFTREMVSRYNDSPAIWGWEFGNEANLGIDLNNGSGGRHGRRGLFQVTQPSGNQLSSEQLQMVLAMFAQTVRSIDKHRIIESGTCLPRLNAWHMAHGSPGRDNAEQALSSVLSLSPDPMDVISIHAYEKAKSNFPGAGSIADVLRSVSRAAAADGKPVFVGEFPVRDPGQAEEFLDAIVAMHIPLSAFWVFDLPQQEATMNVSFTNQRAFAIDMVVKANRALQGQ